MPSGRSHGQRGERGAGEDRVARPNRGAAEEQRPDQERQRRGNRLEPAHRPQREGGRQRGERETDPGRDRAGDGGRPPCHGEQNEHAGDHAGRARRVERSDAVQAGDRLEPDEPRVAEPLDVRSPGVPHQAATRREVVRIAHTDPGVVGREPAQQPAKREEPRDAGRGPQPCQRCMPRAGERAGRARRGAQRLETHVAASRRPCPAGDTRPRRRSAQLERRIC
jgi:hypothetical protein